MQSTLKMTIIYLVKNTKMKHSYRIIHILALSISLFICHTTHADEDYFRHAQTLRNEGRFDQAIEIYKNCLLQHEYGTDLSGKELSVYTDALVQLMNTYQSKGEPTACISALQELFKESPLLQNQCLRDYYSVLAYALSRTEMTKEAEATMLKALTLPLYKETPERYFRDYAYASAVFYSNPDYHKEVINWCQEALRQAALCDHDSGMRWVTTMLGSLYKQNGDLNRALELFNESKEEAQERNDHLAVLNSLHALTDLFIYWDIPEYADLYASEAMEVERNMTAKNPMISAQTYINKGRTLHRLGMTDSIIVYAEEARKLCESLPYNSGMVDINLLLGRYLTDKGGDSLDQGIRELEHVTAKGSSVTRAKAYYHLGNTYLRLGMATEAEIMLDSMYVLVTENDSPKNLRIDYQPILEHYLKHRNHAKVEDYLELMFHEEQAFKEKRLNFNLVESIVDLQTGKNIQELKIMKLRQTNQRLWYIASIVIFMILISFTVLLYLRERKQHKRQMKEADKQHELLMERLNQSNVEKENITREIEEFLKDKENRQELETLTPFILKESGEAKFRQCFEVLHPLFLPRLRERVPAVTRREELLSMLIVLKQDNKMIADLLAIEPRSVLMLRHRFRQKIGMTTEYSLENFIDDILDVQKRAGQ